MHKQSKLESRVTNELQTSAPLYRLAAAYVLAVHGAEATKSLALSLDIP